MKIIKHGNEYYEKECSKCGCFFGYLKKEIRTKYDESPFDYNQWSSEEFIKCPECSNRITLNLMEK